MWSSIHHQLILSRLLIIMILFVCIGIVIFFLSTADMLSIFHYRAYVFPLRSTYTPSPFFYYVLIKKENKLGMFIVTAQSLVVFTVRDKELLNNNGSRVYDNEPVVQSDYGTL